MTVTIDISEVRAAIDTDNLELDLPDDPELQKKVNEHFPAVFDIWAESPAVDPYETFSIDGVADEDGPCVPPGVTVSRERGSDIRSACCHTIRTAIEDVYGQDPSGSNTLAKG